MTQFLDNHFHISEHGSTIGREIIGGSHNFMTMTMIIGIIK